MDGQKERQGDFVFTAQTVGEYRFCFSNEMSTYADKMVDFEVAVSSNVCQRAASHGLIPLFYRSSTSPDLPFSLKKLVLAPNNTRLWKIQSSKSADN